MVCMIDQGVTLYVTKSTTRLAPPHDYLPIRRLGRGVSHTMIIERYRASSTQSALIPLRIQSLLTRYSYLTIPAGEHKGDRTPKALKSPSAQSPLALKLSAGSSLVASTPSLSSSMMPSFSPSPLQLQALRRREILSCRQEREEVLLARLTSRAIGKLSTRSNLADWSRLP